MASNANQAEIAAYEKVKKILGNPNVFASPAGSSAGFPDFGFTMPINNKILTLQFEYKLNAKAQMGSMRDWIFDGQTFTVSEINEEKEVLLFAMNDSDKCVARGKEILKEFQKYGDKRIQKIYSGMLTVESDQKLRRSYLLNYVNGKKTDYQLAKINNNQMGDAIINHYKKKFVKYGNKQAVGNILFMMIGNQIFYVDKTSSVKNEDLTAIAKYFKVAKFTKLDNLSAALEVRIQPRGLSSPDKRVSIDVMASLRLNGLSISGTKIQ